jgi:chromosome segregation ATPase
MTEPQKISLPKTDLVYGVGNGPVIQMAEKDYEALVNELKSLRAHVCAGLPDSKAQNEAKALLNQQQEVMAAMQRKVNELASELEASKNAHALALEVIASHERLMQEANAEVVMVKDENKKLKAESQHLHAQLAAKATTSKKHSQKGTASPAVPPGHSV